MKSKGSGREISCTGIPVAYMIHPFTDEVYARIMKLAADLGEEAQPEEIARALEAEGLRVSPKVVAQCLEMLDYDPNDE